MGAEGEPPLWWAFYMQLLSASMNKGPPDAPCCEPPPPSDIPTFIPPTPQVGVLHAAAVREHVGHDQGQQHPQVHAGVERRGREEGRRRGVGRE